MTHSLNKLMKNIPYEVITGKEDIEFSSGIVCDSRNISEGCVFVCIHGHIFDAHRYIPEAVEKGAKAIIVSEDQDVFSDEELISLSERAGVAFLRVPDTRLALAIMSSSFFENPADQLELVGITGTKGKTTTSYMVHNILAEAGKDVGLIGTVSYIVSGEVKPASRTTPEAFELQSMLSDMVKSGSEICVMEVSSLGLVFERVHGCRFRVGAFTNLYTDHISQSEHVDMRDYLDAKLRIFEQSNCAVVNEDCTVGKEVAEYAGKFGPVYTFGINDYSDCRAGSLKTVRKKGVIGTEFFVTSPWYNGKVFVALPGRFNVHNALCAIAISGIFEIPFAAVRDALATVTVPGRIQMIPNNRNITILVDYAHNAASLEILLSTLREYCNGRLITVFGCGGNRSKTRRTEMGAVSGKFSDLTFVTTDNPRGEEPGDIIRDILEGLRPTGGAHRIEPDRTAAIQMAIAEAKDDDFVIIAGKGHENYQIFKDKTIHFDDVEVAGEALIRLNEENGRVGRDA